MVPFYTTAAVPRVRLTAVKRSHCQLLIQHGVKIFTALNISGPVVLYCNFYVNTLEAQCSRNLIKSQLGFTLMHFCVVCVQLGSFCAKVMQSVHLHNSLAVRVLPSISLIKILLPPWPHPPQTCFVLFIDWVTLTHSHTNTIRLTHTQDA